MDPRNGYRPAIMSLADQREFFKHNKAVRTAWYRDKPVRTAWCELSFEVIGVLFTLGVLFGAGVFLAGI